MQIRSPRHMGRPSCRVAGQVLVWLVGLLLGVVAWPAGAQSVYVEDSPAAMELAERARQWRGQGRLTDAVAALVELAETYPGKLMPLGDGRYVDAAWWVRRELAGDDELRVVYERDAEPAAARALAAVLARVGHAEADGWYDAEALAEVGRRYWLTGSGLSANLSWCAVMLERGEPSAALAGLEQLSGHPWMAREATAARGAALRSEAVSMREALAASALRHLSGVDAGLPVERASLDRALWTAWWNDLVDGSASVNALSANVEMGVVIRGGNRALIQGNGRGNQNGRAGLTRLGLQPGVALGLDTVWVSDGMSVANLDRASGRARWSRLWRAESPQAIGQSLMDRRGVMVSGARVYAVMGPARVSSPRNRGQVAGLPNAELWCLDRETGAQVWSASPGDLDEAFAQAGFMGVPVEAGPGVVAVRLRRVQPSGFVDSYVAGVDAATGRLRWTRHLASTSHANGMSSMPPAVPMVAAGGRLFVDEGLGVAAALDPRDGGLWWLRKTVVNQAELEAPADAAEALDEVREMFEGGGGRVAARRMRTASVQGQTGPAVLGSGVLVAKLVVPTSGRSATSGGAWLLDPATGEALRDVGADEAPWVTGGRWTAARSMGSAGPVDRLLVLGSKLWCLDAETFDVRWIDDGAVSQAGDHLAVPVVDDDQVLVMSGPALRTYGLASGALRDTLAWPAGAAWAAGRGEVVSVTPQAVNGYMSVAQGQRHLRRRIAAADGGAADPEPGLAMATLGVAAERADLLLEGATAALQAVNAAQQTGDLAGSLDDDDVNAMLNALSGKEPAVEDDALDDAWAPAAAAVPPVEAAADANPRGVSVVLELIRLAAGAQALPADARRAVFDRVAASVTGPDELVAYHLALGPLEGGAGNPGDAAAHYQAVLRDELLSDRTTESDGQARRAGLIARHRLAALIAEVGFEVYEPFERQARRELSRLTSDALTRPEEFVALADRYPLAEASAESLLLASAAFLEDGQTPRAVGPLRRAYRTARTDATRGRAAGGLASLYVDQGRFGTAQSWLQRVAREFPELEPVRGGVPVSLTAWVAQLQEIADASSALPAFNPLSPPDAWTVPGTLMPVAAEADATHRRNHAVLRQDNTVAVVDLANRRAVRSKVLPARDAVVLRFSDDQLVLFSAERSELYVIDIDGPNNAAVIPLRIEPLLNTAGAPLDVNLPANEQNIQDLDGLIENLNIQGGGRVVINGRVVVNGRPTVVRRFAVATDTLLVVADSAGRVVALDRLTLKPQWTYRVPGVAVTGLTADDDTAVLFGAAGAPQANRNGNANRGNTPAGVVVALDLLTGQRRGQPIREQSQPPLHAQPRPDGTLLVTFPTFIASYTLDDTQLRWRSPKPFDLSAPFVAPLVVGDGVLAATFSPALPSRAVLLLDPATGNPDARIVAGLDRAAPAPPDQRLAVADGRLHVLAPRPVCHADNGLLLWRSAARNDGFNALHQALAARHVLVLVQSPQPLPTPGDVDTPPTRYRLDAYERDTGRLVAQHPLPLGNGAVITQLSRLYDHHLAYCNSQDTTFLATTP